MVLQSGAEVAEEGNAIEGQGVPSGEGNHLDGCADSRTGSRREEALLAEGAKPAFAAPSLARPLLNPSMFVLISMLASAFLAHYNAPKFFAELEGAHAALLFVVVFWEGRPPLS